MAGPDVPRLIEQNLWWALPVGAVAIAAAGLFVVRGATWGRIPLFPIFRQDEELQWGPFYVAIHHQLEGHTWMVGSQWF